MPDLVLIPANTAGYDAIINSNSQEINDHFSSMLNADNNTGATAIVNAVAQTSAQLIDSTTGTPSTTINDVGVSFSQSVLNNNFASLTNQVNKLQTELNDLHTKFNLLLASLRQTGGVGVLSD